MRNTKKNREIRKNFMTAIKTECEKVYGKKIGTNASKFDWDLRFMPQPNYGENWAYVSWNDFDCMIDAIRTYGTCYYVGKKPTIGTVGRTCDDFVKVSEKELKALKTIKYENLESVKNLMDWENGINTKERKNAEMKSKLNKMALDFGGEITLKEIKDRFSNYYVNSKKTKISFHKRADATHYYRKPEFSINIKPARKDEKANGWYMEVYNKSEFESKIKEVM